VTTIGGEPGGRAPIVVEGNAAPKPPAAEHTTVVVGKPEPGRDIFAGEPAKNVKSSDAGPPREPEMPKVKVVSEVNTATTPAATTSVKDENPPASKDESTESREEAGGTPQYPLPEADALADKIAKELYPEA
jgi:dolichyl-phosphate-mannose-protein mannosyltransferase